MDGFAARFTKIKVKGSNKTYPLEVLAKVVTDSRENNGLFQDFSKLLINLGISESMDFLFAHLLLAIRYGDNEFVPVCSENKCYYFMEFIHNTSISNIEEITEDNQNIVETQYRFILESPNSDKDILIISIEPILQDSEREYFS